MHLFITCVLPLLNTVASSKLLTQIGQDVTITSEHAKLINKQRKRIKHLQKVLVGLSRSV